jgi:DNA-binding response OmpR family regulator
MTLSSMIVSRDWQEVSVLECILGGMEITVDVEPRPEKARAKLATAKFDALIVDCDLEGTDQVIRGLQTRPNQVAMPIAFMARAHGFTSVQDPSAAFMLQKPISVEEAVHALSAARNNMVGGRLRYHRAFVNLPMWLEYEPKKRMDAELTNLSQGGIGVHCKKKVDLASTILVNFALPGTDLPLTVSGEVVWNDPTGNAGIRFVGMKEQAKKTLQLWLERQYFTD